MPSEKKAIEIMFKISIFSTLKKCFSGFKTNKFEEVYVYEKSIYVPHKSNSEKSLLNRPKFFDLDTSINSGLISGKMKIRRKVKLPRRSIHMDKPFFFRRFFNSFSTSTALRTHSFCPLARLNIDCMQLVNFV